LGVEQLIKRVEAARVARFPIDLRQSSLDGVLYLGRFLTTPFQSALDDFLFTRALGDAFGIGLIPARQIF